MAPGMMIARNNPNVSQWNPDYGYKSKMTLSEYPIRAVYPKFFLPSPVFQINTENIEHECKGSDHTTKVTFTMPGDVSKMSRNSYRIHSSKVSYITINTNVVNTSFGLHRYQPHQRQCFYNSERQLRFFKIYTENNCREECLANFTKIYCGCVKFSMPSKSAFKLL